jgi:TRAP-type C4-dicarboxylate transport system permease small subunit
VTATAQPRVPSVFHAGGAPSSRPKAPDGRSVHRRDFRQEDQGKPVASPHPDTGQSDLAKAVDAAARAADLGVHDDGAGRFGRAINRAAEAAGVAVLATIVLIVFFNAVGRYAFRYTFIWGDELVLSLLPWLGMLGMFLSIRRRQVIRIEYFVQSRAPVLRRVLEIAGSLAAAAAFLYLAIISVQYLQFFGADRTIYLRIQKGYFMAAMVIGPALAALAYLTMVYEDFRGRRRRNRAAPAAEPRGVRHDQRGAAPRGNGGSRS